MKLLNMKACSQACPVLSLLSMLSVHVTEHSHGGGFTPALSPTILVFMLVFLCKDLRNHQKIDVIGF